MEAATAAQAGSSAPAPPVAAPGAHWLRIGSRRVQVVGPSIRDPRIHLSLTILTIITIGTVWLGFQLSIPQIVVTIVACGVTEAAYLCRRTGRLVWPASAFQTATSTVLLFRVIGTEERGYSTFHGVALFVAVALAGLATKYFVRFRGGHVFNPSNVALVAAFLVLGSNRVEPLDFWWAPIGPAMIAAYVVIFAGGLFICGRLHLLAMGLTFWITLAVGMGILAALGHTITTRWSLTPIGGAHFWWIIMTSPEIFIFLFFMITDPKTVPSGRVARVVFGFSIGVVASLLMAPWDTEFGVKVGLLSGLVVICAVRPFAERYFPVAGSDDDRLGVWLGGLLAAPSPDGSGRRHAFARIALASVGMLAFGGGVAAAGLPNTDPAVERRGNRADPADHRRLAVRHRPGVAPHRHDRPPGAGTERLAGRSSGRPASRRHPAVEPAGRGRSGRHRRCLTAAGRHRRSAPRRTSATRSRPPDRTARASPPRSRSTACTCRSCIPVACNEGPTPGWSPPAPSSRPPTCPTAA